ncbi:MAG: aminotransferase class V-fold PLP-dependent enzyme [Anaerolineales bacterium]|nr:aminotransferase class V-fold PLP-dependent enzyme [Anaerolineales bacterium]
MFNLKQRFLLDPSITFLNHGSFGATPKPVFDEYQRWQRELENQPVEFLGRRVTDLMADARAALGEYLGTRADNLIYTQNVTISMNIVARSLELGAGDEVLTSDHEYGAMDRAWRFLSKERGFAYINQLASLESRAAFVESFWAGVTPRTRIIFLSHITSPTALILPIAEIIQRAREAGIITIIDGAHVAGQLPLHLDSLGADFYGGNLHKWLCAPKGAGFLYARPEMQRLLKPLVVSWGYESLAPSASQFVDHHEWWGTRDVSAFLSVPAAIRFQREHDWDKVRAACHQLVKDAQTRVCKLTGLPPIHSASDDWFAQLAAAPLPDDTDIVALKSRLYDEYRVEIPLTTWRDKKLIRISIQGYNSRKDVDCLLEALRAAL